MQINILYLQYQPFWQCPGLAAWGPGYSDLPSFITSGNGLHKFPEKIVYQLFFTI